MSRFVRLLMLAALLGGAGCERKPSESKPGKVSSEDVRRDVNEALKTTAEYSAQAKEDFEKKLATQISDLDMKIAELREKGRDLSGDAKAEWDKNVAGLEADRKVLSEKLVDVQKAVGDAWKDVQEGSQSAWDDMKRARPDTSKE